MRLTFGMCLLLAVQGALAQSSEEDELALSYGDKAFVSIATGSLQPVSRAPAVATVITAQDIAAMGATDLDEVLETVPGLHVARETQVFAPVYIMRGINFGFNPQVLVLLNGHPQTTAYNGNRGNVWGGFPVEHVERIEVIRGPGSALYGADAFAGVINIILKSAASLPGTQLGVRAGSFKTGDAWVSHVGTCGPADVSAYLRVGATQGARSLVAADAQTGIDAIFGSQASRAPGPINNEREFVDGSLEVSKDQWRWRVGYRLRDNMGLGTGVASALDPTGNAKGEYISNDVGFDDPHWREDLALSVQASFLHFTELARVTLYPAGALNGAFTDGVLGNPDKWMRHGRLSAALTYTGLSQHRLRLGFGLEEESIYRIRETKNFTFTSLALGPQPIGTGSHADLVDVSDTAPYMRPHSRTNRYLYLQDEWNFLPDWTLTAGWRHDQYSDFGGTSNPRLAVVWDAAYNVTAKLLYGRAFRAPAMAELYAINNPVITGNPALLPETIETVEAALAWQPEPGLRLGMNLFHYRMRNIIGLVSTVYQNKGGQTGQGLELEANWDLNRAWRLSGNFSHQRSVDAATGAPAAGAPANHLSARADWRFMPGWSLHPQLNWISERPRDRQDTRAPLKGYAMAHLTLKAQPMASPWQWSMTVRNLFDADAREPTPNDSSASQPFISLPHDFPLPGRSVSVQATYQF